MSYQFKHAFLICFTFATIMSWSNITYADNNDVNQALEDTQSKLKDAAESASTAASKIANSTQEFLTKEYKQGKIKSLLFFNKHLSSYDLSVEVEDSRATLSGTVSKTLEKDYAEQIALGVEGINRVNNLITVTNNEPENRISKAAEKLTSSFKDASVTAQIKAKLIANNHIDSLKIKVRTDHMIVTLTGSTSSLLEKDLVEQIALNVPDVRQVFNQLIVQ